jgi:prophage regulatory protein
MSKAPLRLLRLKEVEQRTGLHKTTIYERERAGKFPKHVKVTERLNAWAEHEINEYIEELLAGRDKRRPRAVP